MKKKSLFYILLSLGVLLVIIFCVAMGYMMRLHKHNSMLFKNGENAFLQGDYDTAETALKTYLAKDKNKEEAWKYLAEIYESRNRLFDAAKIWRRLVNLNIMSEEYLTRCINAYYKIHDYASLSYIFDNCAGNRRENFKEIYALTKFKLNPKSSETSELIEGLPDSSNVKRLIMAMQNLGPSSELEFLKNSGDQTIQVEAYILDASIAENMEKDMARAEQDYKKASVLNSQLCLAELGDFYFRNNRYKEALEVFSNHQTYIFSENTFLNFVEILFYERKSDELKKIEEKVSDNIKNSIAIRAYIQCLDAFLSKDIDKMLKYYEVAQIRRATPMGLVLNYAVGVAKHDIALVAAVLRRWKGTDVFEGKKDMIINDARILIEEAIKNGRLQEAASIARLVIDIKPPEPLVWHALLLENASKGRISEDLLKQAIELFPNDKLIRSFALRAAYAKGDNSGIVKAFDDIIATSDKPFTDRYRKALYFEQRGMNDEAFAEIKKILEEDNTLEEAKHCLAYGMRTGNKKALELAGKYPELAEIARFESERRYGDAETAVKILKEHEIEKELKVESIPDREILLPIAIYLGLAGENQRAVTALEAVKPYTLSSPTVELNLSENYAILGDKKHAMSNAESAYSRFPESIVVRAVYGLRCAENNDFHKAVDLISDSAVEPRFRTTLVNSLELKIKASFAERRYATAKTSIDRLLSLQPDNQCAKEHLEKLNAMEEAENKEL